MKSILYVGATLMIGASIYGFVDYKQTQNRKEFKEMYVEEMKKEPVVISDNNIPEPIVKKESGSNEKKVVAKNQVINKDESITAIKPIAEDEKISVNETKVIEKTSVDIKASKDNGVTKKKKKLNHKIFSRAPLRDEEEEINLVEPVKTEVKKTETKEQ